MLSRPAPILLLLATLSLGCLAPRDAFDFRAAGRPWLRTELYFGRAIPAGGEVTDEQWRQFLAEVVTPRFPAGFSVLEASGQWRGDDGAVAREASQVLLIYHAPDADSQRKVNEIADAYARMFGQESVMRVTTRAWVKF